MRIFETLIENPSKLVIVFQLIDGSRPILIFFLVVFYNVDFFIWKCRHFQMRNSRLDLLIWFFSMSLKMNYLALRLYIYILRGILIFLSNQVHGILPCCSNYFLDNGECQSKWIIIYMKLLESKKNNIFVNRFVITRK